jgi:hypothetical protein
MTSDNRCPSNAGSYPSTEAAKSMDFYAEGVDIGRSAFHISFVPERSVSGSG